MNKKAFSIAEATIALLIGSLILGMAAPMISKQIKNNNANDAQISILLRRIENLERNNTTSIPAGSIIFFEGNCPDDTWTDMSNAFAGRYVRIAGTYDICDKQGENADGSCVSTKSTATISAGLKQGEANRRIVGTTPATTSTNSTYIGHGFWGKTNTIDGYVELLKEHGSLTGVFDYVTSSQVNGTDSTSPFKLPTGWQNFQWPVASYPKMYNTNNTYLQYLQPSFMSPSPMAPNGSPRRDYINSIDTKRVLPTDTTNDETRPKTIVLRACKAPSNN